MSELPTGWDSLPLAQACIRITDGTHHSPVNVREGQFKYVTAKNIRRWGLDLEDITYVDENVHAGIYARCPVERGDILYIKDGATTGIAINNPLDEPFSMLSSVALLKPDRRAVDERYLRFWLNDPDTLARMIGQMSGTAIRRLTLATISAQDLPIPPLAEQQRIVAKVDALTARTTRAQADLNHIPTLAAQYKTRVLQQAFTGSLTETWRDATAQIDRGCRKISELSLDGGERGEWASDDLPLGWEWRAFSETFDDVTDSRRKLPTNEYQVTGKYPIVDQGDVHTPGYTDREDMVQRASPPFVVFGDHTRCVKYVDRPFVQGADGVKVLVPRNGVGPRYAELLMRGISLPDKGYSRHAKFLRASYFPICSSNEQEKIVRRIDRAFAEIDRLTAEAAAARKLLGRLDQAILAKAFRGELVPQDPADEPASILLDRIRSEHLSAPKAKRGRMSAA